MSYLREVKEDIEGLKNAVEEVLSARNGSNNVNTVKIEGAGSIWNGIAIGIALGAVIAGSVAVMASLQQMNLRVQQAEAFQAALYMVAPRLGKEIDEDLDKRKARQEEQGRKD